MLTFLAFFSLTRKRKTNQKFNVMKKFLTILLISVMTSSMAFAQYRPQKTAQSRTAQVGLATPAYQSNYGRMSRTSARTASYSNAYSRPEVNKSRAATTTTAKPLTPVRYYTNSQRTRVQSPTKYSSAPAGATARCKDGTFSFSRNKRGTCSHHGGVAEWL